MEALERSPDRRVSLGLGAVLLGTLLAYGGVLGNPFWAEDHAWIARAYQAIDAPGRILTSVFQRDYNPAAYAVFVLNYLAAGRWAPGWHAVDLALHLACTLLVFTMVRRCCASPAAALVGATAFGIHPAISEPVVWSAARFHSEALACVLAGHLAGVRRPALRIAAPAAGLAVGLLFKETAVGFAAVVVGWSLWTAWRRPAAARPEWVRTAAVLGVVVLYAVLRLTFLRDPYVGRAATGIEPRTALTKLTLTVVAFVGLEERLPDHPAVAAVPTAAMVLMVLVTRDPVLALGGIWTLGMAAPYLALPFHSSRYLYLPWPGLCLLLARLVERLGRSSSRVVRFAGASAFAIWVVGAVLSLRLEIADYRLLGQAREGFQVRLRGLVQQLEDEAGRAERFRFTLVDESTLRPLRGLGAELHGRPKLLRELPQGVEGAAPLLDALGSELSERRIARILPSGDATAPVDRHVVWRGTGQERLLEGPAARPLPGRTHAATVVLRRAAGARREQVP